MQDELFAIAVVAEKRISITDTSWMIGHQNSIRAITLFAENEDEAKEMALEYAKRELYKESDGYYGHVVGVLEVPEAHIRRAYSQLRE